MKYLFLFISLLISISIFSQRLKTIAPYNIDELSDSAAEEFEKNEKQYSEIIDLIDRGVPLDSLPEEDKELLDSFDETQEGYWIASSGGCSWYCGAEFSEITASSTLSSQGENSYKPENVHDSDYTTAWVEGVNGHGIGEFLKYSFPASGPRITNIIIANGYVKSAAAWKNNGRIKKLKVYLNEDPVAILQLEDKRAVQYFEIQPLGLQDRDQYETYKDITWFIKFEILEVYSGEKYEDTAISEIYFDGIDVHCFAAGTMITMFDHTQKPIEQLQIGDEVLSYNLDRKTFKKAKIKELSNPIHKDLIRLRFDDNSTLICTKDHPLMTALGTWVSCLPSKTKSQYSYDQVGMMQVGSVLKCKTGTKTVKAIETITGFQPTYTIVRLEVGNTFMANNIIVGTEPLRKRKSCIQGDDMSSE